MQLNVTNKLAWVGRVAVTAALSYALSIAFYNPKYISPIDWYSQTMFPTHGPRIRKMNRLWPPFQHPLLWILHSIAILLLFHRFVKEEHLLATLRRFGFIKQQPGRIVNFCITVLLCTLVSIAEFQLLLPTIRLAEIHPVVIAMDFVYMLLTSFLTKIVLKTTTYSTKTKEE